jgi:hypothetical protein
VELLEIGSKSKHPDTLTVFFSGKQPVNGIQPFLFANCLIVD